jgi:AAA domain-containing protein
MLRLDKVIKPWKESASLNDHINLYGFWNETAFLTKSGDLGMILSVPGVDYESLDRSQQEYAVKRLEAALKAFGPGFHVYQYLFKSNRPDIPFAKYDDPIVEAAIEQRRKFFEAKRNHLYQVEIFYCILLEGSRSKTGVGTALARLLRDPEGAIAELKSQFTNDSMKKLLRTHIERDLQRLDQHVQAFARQLADFMQIEILNQQGQFTFFRRLLNYDDWRIAGRPQSTQFLDYQVVNSDIEAERDHLRVGDHIVRVVTMKEAITETRPLVLDALLKIPANFYVVTEWTPLPADKARKEVNKRRRHFNMSKTGFVSQMGNDATKTNPRDVLVDESKQAAIENLGDCLRALGDGQSLGDFSLTIVLYGRSRADIDQLVAEFTGVFTNADGNLFVETYNQLNAYFATVPGNCAMNLRQLYMLNTNYADLSFLFTILPGEKTNEHLGTEYWAVLETDNSTPYFLNLHTRDVAHTLILGMTGSGKTTTLTAIRSTAESRGFEVEGFAPTSRAARQLREAGIEAGTLQRFLAQPANPYLREQKHFYLVDESSLASTNQMREFLARIGAHDRVLLIGDIRQHQGVEAGRPFEQLQEAGMRTARLDEIVRQKDPALKSAVELLAAGNVSAALDTLQQQGRVIEIPNAEDRIRAIAKSYVESPANTLIVSPDNASRRELNVTVRQELKLNGTLASEDHSFGVLVQRQDMTGAERSWASHYEVNDIIRYTRGSKAMGIEAAAYASVVAIDPAANLLTVEKANLELATYDPRRLTGVSVYREIEHEFSVGDRIQFTAPDKSLGVANRDLATIEAIHPDGWLSARLDNNRQIEFNTSDHRHFDHGYAVTSHSSQSLTAERVLVHADTRVHPDLLNSRFGYVSISRASHEATLFTDDMAKLGPQLGADVSKTSALGINQDSSIGQAIRIGL